MKPVELVERALRNNSKSRDTILVPFAGSGTTIIACEKTRRQARVIELDPVYCDVIVRRWEGFTGRVAHRDQMNSGGEAPLLGKPAQESEGSHPGKQDDRESGLSPNQVQHTATALQSGA